MPHTLIYYIHGTRGVRIEDTIHRHALVVRAAHRSVVGAITGVLGAAVGHMLLIMIRPYRPAHALRWGSRDVITTKVQQ